MPRNQETQQLTYNSWEQVTANDVDEITFLVTSGSVDLRIAGGTAPAATATGWPYGRGEGETKKPLTEYTPTTDKRVWMRSTTPTGAHVVISHA